VTTLHAYAFFASLIFVGLKSWQQQNVTHEKYWWILPTSLAMGVFEVYIVAQVAKTGYDFMLVVAIGCGSGIGATIATWLHSRLRKSKT
jgi:Na+/glutamate symporter